MKRWVKKSRHNVNKLKEREKKQYIKTVAYLAANPESEKLLMEEVKMELLKEGL